MVVRVGEAQYHVRVHLVGSYDDIPAVSGVNQLAGHTSYFPWRLCTIRVYQFNSTMCLSIDTIEEGDPCRDRTAKDYIESDLKHGIKKQSPFKSLYSFFSPYFLGVDTFRLFDLNIAKQIRSLLSSEGPFLLKAKSQKEISDIIKNQTTMPSVFSGEFKEFLNPSAQIRGVDWSLFLQFVVPTLVVEQIQIQQSKRPTMPAETTKKIITALCQISRICGIATKCDIDEEEIAVLDKLIDEWLAFVFDHLKPESFTVNQHYLAHLVELLKAKKLQQVNCKTLERRIQMLKKSMNAKSNVHKNAEYAIVNQAYLNYAKRAKINYNKNVLAVEDVDDCFNKPSQLTDFEQYSLRRLLSDLVGMQFLLNPLGNIHLPITRVAILLFALLVLMRKNQLADAASETMMKFFNLVLHSLVYYHDGIQEFADCTSCHIIHPYTTASQKEKMQNQLTCFGKGILPSSPTCMEDLFKTNQYGTLAPVRSVFCNSVISTLRNFFMRDTFVDDIKKWKTRITITGKLVDIYDGLVRNEFKTSANSPEAFVEESDYNLLFTLNCDWFQSYKDSYSVEAIYMTIQNLPRETRTKHIRDEQLSKAIIRRTPSADEWCYHEYPEQWNPNWQGYSLFMHDGPSGSKKVAGFTSFNSKHPFHKCKEEFDEIPGSKNHAWDFNDFEDSTWVRRTCEEHRAQAKIWRLAAVKARRKEMEAKNDTRWSGLLKLPYFDPIRHVDVDVNGAIVEAVLGNDELRSMQKSLEEGMLLPPSHATSSIARKLTIGSGFSNFEADEWATWLLVLSPILLVDKLDNQKFSHWMLFVSAAHVLFPLSLLPNWMKPVRSLDSFSLVSFRFMMTTP
ncbi:hypothetical protein EDC96DRAFT_581302 [Choanephora cucurbitarum]|nr:hypothetical protein EDC96DRAFT_581302 [Choanephora cucurbitarum]